MSAAAQRYGDLKVAATARLNLGTEPFCIRRGDRIAQLVIAPVARAAWREVPDLAPSGRATGGFGHTDRAD